MLGKSGLLFFALFPAIRHGDNLTIDGNLDRPKTMNQFWSNRARKLMVNHQPKIHIRSSRDALVLLLDGLLPILESVSILDNFR